MNLYERFKADLFPGPCSDREALDLFRELESYYHGPGRSYHTLYGHIQNCLNVFSSVNHGAEDPLAIRVALYFHDVFNDEDKSAEYAFLRLRDIGSPERFCETVMFRILATKHTIDPSRHDDRVIADVDLSELAVDWRTFALNSNALRQEELGVGSDEYRNKKITFFTRLLEREHLYYGTSFQILFEARARENISRAMTEFYA